MRSYSCTRTSQLRLYQDLLPSIINSLSWVDSLSTQQPRQTEMELQSHLHLLSYSHVRTSCLNLRNQTSNIIQTILTGPLNIHGPKIKHIANLGHNNNQRADSFVESFKLADCLALNHIVWELLNSEQNLKFQSSFHDIDQTVLNNNFQNNYNNF